ncbi:MAG: DUF2442 domain-containing protein [Planctomycetes bacterium]|nr:DUF2442 domain-containing protein [Planctomycetota bacterium]
MLRISQVEVCSPHSLRLLFTDGTSKVVDLLPLLEGPIFEPLRDPGYFSQVKLDPVCGTVVWPNGADLAPEALHELESQEKRAAS